MPDEDRFSSLENYKAYLKARIAELPSGGKEKKDDELFFPFMCEEKEIVIKKALLAAENGDENLPVYDNILLLLEKYFSQHERRRQNLPPAGDFMGDGPSVPPSKEEKEISNIRRTIRDAIEIAEAKKGKISERAVSESRIFQEQSSEIPKNLTFELTMRCNFKCPYCYCIWHEDPKLYHFQQNLQEWMRTINDAAHVFKPKNILFSGGEPLLFDWLQELLSHARQALPDTRLTVFTNGSLMTEELLQWFKEKRIFLATSLQGLKTYKEMTGTRRSYKRQLEFIARAAEIGWPVFVSITITRANRFEAADIFSAAVLSGASSILIGPMMAGGRGLEHLDLMLTADEWNEVKAEISALPNPGIPFSFANELICTCQKHPAELLERFKNPEVKECRAGRDFAVIAPDGWRRKCIHTTESLIDEYIDDDLLFFKAFRKKKALKGVEN